MPFHGILSLILLAVIIFGGVALVRLAFGPHAHRGHGRSPGLDVLQERYAKGEIQREEYLQKKRDLDG